MINIGIRDDHRTLGKFLIFELLDGSRKKLEYYMSGQEICFLTEPNNYNNAIEARTGNEALNSFISVITDFVYRGFNITDEYVDRQYIKDIIQYTIYKSSRKYIKQLKEIEKTQIDEDIKDAIEISKKAMDYGKKINDMKNEIEKDKNDYYKKYGTLIEKGKAYLKKIHNNNL